MNAGIPQTSDDRRQKRHEAEQRQRDGELHDGVEVHLGILESAGDFVPAELLFYAEMRVQLEAESHHLALLPVQEPRRANVLGKD